MATSAAEAWEVLADHLRLVERFAGEEMVEVDATAVKAITGWEPRLLMKMDSRVQRPPALARVGGTVLPVRNGRYAIVATDGYHELEEPPACSAFHLSETARGIRTLPWDTIPSSESQMLDMALASGMMQHYLAETHLALTIRGRLRSPAFTFQCAGRSQRAVELHVDGVQIEVDAGLEGERIHLVEAKLGKRSDFHVRQLYYPYRMWSQRSGGKSVEAVFCAYHDRQFYFWTYAFVPEDHYHGLQLTRSAVYTLDPEIVAPSWRSVVQRSLQRSAEEPQKIPFPQADSLERVIDLMDALAQGLADTASLIERYDFTERQADYYLNAARYLGFVQPGRRELTPDGARFVAAKRNARHVMLLEAMLQRPVFRQVLAYTAETDSLPDAQQVQSWLGVSTTLSGSTLGRRARTVLSWARWAIATR